MEGRLMDGSCRPPPSLLSVPAGLGTLAPFWKTCTCQHQAQHTPRFASNLMFLTWQITIPEEANGGLTELRLLGRRLTLFTPA